jgi:phosphoribosylamine--glycine ligase
MKILVLGGGGREHAVVRAFSESELKPEIFCCPGNPGIAEIATCLEGNICNPDEMAALAKDKKIDLVFVGPEAPLVAGTADALRASGILVMGPGKSGARLEGSKEFSKKFMERHGVPTSAFDCCTDLDSCIAALKKRSAPYVVKADGLAAGKGAFLPETYDEAVEICKMMLEENKLGSAGSVVIVEDYVKGVETTVLAITDGETVRVLPSSQDHKRALDDDKGNNTGGMGACSPVPWVDSAFLKKINDLVLKPTLAGLKSENIPFCGVIYAGIMVKPDGSLSVLEYNVRLGDPEAQVVLPVFGGDFGKVILSCCQGKLAEAEWPEPKCTALGVVMASGGYPAKFEKGYEITGLDKKSADTFVYHAGTKRNESGKIVTSGGRVLTVVGTAPTLTEARDIAYSRVKEINFKDAHYRKDIGKKSIKEADN